MGPRAASVTDATNATIQMMMSPGMFMPPFMPPPMDMSQMMAMGYGNQQQGMMMDHGQGQQGPPQFPMMPTFRPPPSMAPPSARTDYIS